MPQTTITKLPKSQVKITFTVTPDEARPYLDQAVTDISTAKPIKGFRPGHATYEDVKRAYGEMLIWETALERIVRARYVKTILDEGLETIGSPAVAVDKLVPNQDIVFTTTSSVMPDVTNLADYTKPLVEERRKTIAEEDVDRAIQNLRKMRRTEAAVNRPATKDDLVQIDLVIKKDKVQIEGGTSHDYRVVLNEPHYIPGFSDKLVGHAKGEKLEFTLDFPEEHYNKMLAGTPAEFEVTMKEVFELRLPELNDEFAKGIGVESLGKLKDVLRGNLQTEADHKADEAAEIELLEKLVRASRFTEIPDLIVTEEVRRMLNELERSIEQQGGNMRDYLSSIKKTMDNLRLDFIPRAMDRIKTAVILKEVAKRENVSVNDQEIDDEIDRILATLKPDDKDARETVTTPDYREYVAVQMKNRKVVKLLKEKGIRKHV